MPCHDYLFWFLVVGFFSLLTLHLVVFLTSEPLYRNDCWEQRLCVQAPIWTSACSKGQITYSGLSGELAERARGSQGCLPFCLKSDTRLQMGARIAEFMFIRTDKWEHVLSGFYINRHMLSPFGQVVAVFCWRYRQYYFSHNIPTTDLSRFEAGTGIFISVNFISLCLERRNKKYFFAFLLPPFYVYFKIIAQSISGIIFC